MGAPPTPSFRDDPAWWQLPLLVLLDLNGVLVHRDFIGGPFTVRPRALELLEALSARVDVGFCSSMHPTNAKKAIGAIRHAAESANTRKSSSACKLAP